MIKILLIALFLMMLVPNLMIVFNKEKCMSFPEGVLRFPDIPTEEAISKKFCDLKEPT